MNNARYQVRICEQVEYNAYQSIIVSQHNEKEDALNAVTSLCESGIYNAYIYDNLGTNKEILL